MTSDERYWEDCRPMEIDNHLNAICDVLESDKFLSVACNTAEVRTGATIELDAVECQVRDADLLYLGTCIGIEVGITIDQPLDSAQRELAAALRSIADNLDRQRKPEPIVVDVDASWAESDWVFYSAVAAVLALTTWLAFAT